MMLLLIHWGISLNKLRSKQAHRVEMIRSGSRVWASLMSLARPPASEDSKSRKAPLQPRKEAKKAGPHLAFPAKIANVRASQIVSLDSTTTSSQHHPIEKPLDTPPAIMSAPQMVQCFGKKKTATAVAHCKVRLPLYPLRWHAKYSQCL